MPNPELSVVLADSSSQHFTTKGSVDWTALGRMQISGSIEILARLSAAGVEPLTVAVGQAMCSRIPLGVHGEKVLMEAMEKLTAFSSFGDLIWFGVGVRHILRTLVQTSQGASLVALCAALAEGHSIPMAALMMFEMSKVLGSPDDLRPSFAQWEALVKVCSSVFTVTTVGVRLQQLLTLCGYRTKSFFLDGFDYPGYPPELVEALLAIGKVSSGTLRDVELTGGGSCACLAVFAEYILGLRVQVRKASGQLLAMNHSTDQNTQVVVIFDDLHSDTSEVRRTGQSYIISDGSKFIQEFFPGSHTNCDGRFSLAGRVPWQSLLHDVFGDVVDAVLDPSLEPPWLAIMMLSENNDSLRQNAFLTMMVYAAETIVSTSSAVRCRDRFSFLQQMPTRLPELAPIQDRLLKKSYEVQQRQGDTEAGHSSENIRKGYDAAKHDLGRCCNCPEHINFSPDFSAEFCIVQITEFILSLFCMLEHVHFDCHILPQRRGILNLYSSTRWHHGQHAGIDPSLLRSRFITGDWRGNMNDRLKAYHCLFSGSLGRTDSSLDENRACAFGEGTIYCYMDTIVSLTDKVEDAYCVHVGAGTITAKSRHQNWILDGSAWGIRGYPAEDFMFDESGESLFDDTTSSSLRSKPGVHEGVNISFGYELSKGDHGYTRVAPSALAHDLFWSSQHRLLKKTTGILPTSTSLLIENKQLRVIGEGSIPDNAGDDNAYNIILRPHHGNLLGRLSCLTQSPFDALTLLVDDQEDLTRAKLWLESRQEIEKRRLFYFIS